MPDFSDPDGSNQPINNQTGQYLINFPAYALGYLAGTSDAAWEQAVVAYFDGARQSTQLGTYNRPGILWLPQSSLPQQILLAGWHKRGQPDGSLPWVASRGQSNGITASWDDSGGDGDYNDYRVQLIILPGPHPLWTPLPGFSAGRLQPTDADYVAQALVLLAALRETIKYRPPGRGQDPILPVLGEARSLLLAEYRTHHGEASFTHGGIPGDLALATRLALFANTLHEGELRAEFLALVQELLGEMSREGDHRSGS
jgi:hypothetical protein